MRLRERFAGGLCHGGQCGCQLPDAVEQTPRRHPQFPGERLPVGPRDALGFMVLADGEEESRVVLERDPALPADTLSCPAFRQQAGEEGVGIHLFIAERQRQTNGDGKPAAVQPGAIVGKMQNAVLVFP